MKKESSEELEAYKIRIDALEIINEAYLAKIEALELLNRNLQFLRDVKNQGQTATRPAVPASSGKAMPALESGQKRGRGRPRKYPVGTNYYALRLSQTGEQGEKKGRGRPRKYPLAGSAGSTDTATGTAEPGVKKGRGRPRKYPVGTTYADQKKNEGNETGEKRKRGRPRKYPVGTAPATKPSPSIFAGKRRRGRKPKGATGITRFQIPLEIALREMLHDETYNKATYRALSGILLCLFQNKTATVSTLHEYIGGSKVTVVRHTAALKKMKLITYEGSRKKGYYELTPQGQHLYDRLLNA